MAEKWVLNASPVICLARAGLGNLLHELSDELILPKGVIDEINAGPRGDPGIQLLSTLTYSIAQVEANAHILAWDLGLGETGVLSYALDHPDTIAIIDDMAARKCALSFSIQYKGTLALIIQARKRGLIPSAAAAFRAIQSAGLYLNDAVIRKVLLDILHEEW